MVLGPVVLFVAAAVAGDMADAVAGAVAAVGVVAVELVLFVVLQSACTAAFYAADPGGGLAWGSVRNDGASFPPSPVDDFECPTSPPPGLPEVFSSSIPQSSL